jgi:glycosyltransferase involved in cell wall biosynthesis
LPVRILHVINRYWPATGGAERHLQEYAERQAADGHEVTIFTTDAFDLEYFWDSRKRRVARPTDRHNGVRIERFAIHQIPPNGLGFRVARRLLGELDRIPGTQSLQRTLALYAPWAPGLRSALNVVAGRFDLIHGMNIAFEALLYPALRSARIAGIPFLLSPLTHLGESRTNPVRRYYTMRHQIALVRAADLVFMQTPTEARFYVDAGVSVERMVEVGAGVDPGRVTGGDGEAFRRRHGIIGPIVYSLGSMAYDKGTVHLVQAMARHWTAGGAGTLVLAGHVTDPFATFLAAQPESVRQRTRLLGSIDDDEKRDLLSAGDVFAMPSRTDSFGIVFLEAWLAGSPVVAADAGGVPDLVEDGRSGLVVPFGDTAALARAIDRLINDPALALSMARHGAARVRDRHTWDHVYARVQPAMIEASRRSIAA